MKGINEGSIVSVFQDKKGRKVTIHQMPKYGQDCHLLLYLLNDKARFEIETSKKIQAGFNRLSLDHNDTVYLVELGGKCIGYMSWSDYVIPDAAINDSTCPVDISTLKRAMRQLYIVPSCRKKGVAAQLMQSTIIHQRELFGFSAFGVEKPTSDSMRMLERLGYLRKVEKGWESLGDVVFV